MPEYLAPGVFVEETSFRAKSIEGVSTSVAAMVAPTRFGPLRGRPEVLTSYAAYERVFGDDGAFTYDGSPSTNYSALAARAFFDNGGKQLYVSRVAREAKAATAGDGDLQFQARFPGSGGNVDLEFHWEDTQNLLKRTRYSAADDVPEETLGLLCLSGNLKKDLFTTAGTGDFPLGSVKVLATKKADKFEFRDGSQAWVCGPDEDDEPQSVDLSKLAKSIKLDKLTGLDFEFVHIGIAKPASGDLKDDAWGVLVLDQALPFNGDKAPSDIGERRVLLGRIKKDDEIFNIRSGYNGSEVKAVDLVLSALAATPEVSATLLLRRGFSVDVIRRKITSTDSDGKPGAGEVIYRYGGLSFDSDAAGFIGKAMPEHPENHNDALTMPVYCDAATGSSPDYFGALINACHDKLLRLNADSFGDERYVVTLSGGDDGTVPVAGDYAGESNEISGSTGFKALEEIEDISIVMTPHAAACDKQKHQAVIAALQAHCARMRYRIGLVDSRPEMAISEVRELRDQFDDSRLALYYPWVVSADPTGLKPTVTSPPSGYLAGIYARTDVDRGVHKAPANVAVFGALRFQQEINKFQQELLNPAGVNCLRSFPGRGHRVWGGRTMSSDPEWKYVNVRRYFLYLERSIDMGTQWAVFEPNGEQLWTNVRHTIESFLYNEWTNGHLLGGDPKAAYFVRCDRSTMTQNDIDNGRLVCEVGVAPLRPAEFVVFRVGQKTADA